MTVIHIVKAKAGINGTWDMDSFCEDWKDEDTAVLPNRWQDATCEVCKERYLQRISEAKNG